MALTRDVIIRRDDFARAQSFTTTPSGEFGWTIADTSAAGTPTYLCISADGGAAKLLLEATSEAQNVCLYQNDVLPFRLDKLLYVEYNLQVAGVNSVTTIVAGIASARNDTPSSVSQYAWFRMNGATSTANLVVGTSDGTLTKGGTAGTIATGKTLAAVNKRCVIDFSYGLNDVRFFIDGDRVAAGTLFDMSTDGTLRTQLLVQIQKASGAGIPSVTLDHVEIAFRTAA